jgi:hypothetical protein
VILGAVHCRRTWPWYLLGLSNPVEGTSKIQAVISKATTGENIGNVLEMLLARPYILQSRCLWSYSRVVFLGLWRESNVEQLLIARDVADNLMNVDDAIP